MSERVSMGRKLRGTIGGGLAALAGVAVAIVNSQPKPLPELDTRQPIETGQWRVEPLAMYVTEKAIRDIPLRDGYPALVLEARLTNRTAASSSDYQTLFNPGIAQNTRDARPIVILARDRTDNTSPTLHPALPETVVFFWSYPGGRGTASLKVKMNTKSYKAVDNLKGLPGWFNERPIGYMTSTFLSGRSVVAN